MRGAHAGVTRIIKEKRTQIKVGCERALQKIVSKIAFLFDKFYGSMIAQILPFFFAFRN